MLYLYLVCKINLKNKIKYKLFFIVESKNYIVFQYFLFLKKIKFMLHLTIFMIKIFKFYIFLYYVTSVYKNNLYVCVLNNTYINIILQYIL